MLSLLNVRVSIFSHFVANDMINCGVDRHRRTGRTRVSVRRGSIAQDGFDELEDADLKAPIEFTFIDQFGQEEYVPAHLRTPRRLEAFADHSQGRHR